jgi:ATP-dependent Clp protease adaptor protein ClpS
MTIITLDTKKRLLSVKASSGDDYEGQDVRHDGLLLVEPKVKTKRPPYFKVVLLNDDYTPMDFVVFLLKDVFHKDHAGAINTMLEIHQSGAGVCGVYTRDVAETKAELALTLARRSEYPLQCKVEIE